ncbi:hypothetical protein V6615_08965 [Oscillospiraceae bacterium PP1C4]
MGAASDFELLEAGADEEDADDEDDEDDEDEDEDADDDPAGGALGAASTGVIKVVDNIISVKSNASFLM